MDVAERYDGHTDESNSKTTAVEPPKGLGHFFDTAILIMMPKIMLISVLTVVGKHELRKCRSRQDIAHDERKVGSDPHGTAYPMSSNGVNMDIICIDLEIYPVVQLIHPKLTSATSLAYQLNVKA